MVDCWHQLGIRPFEHLICQTPVFRLLLGITGNDYFHIIEYLFRDVAFLEQSIQAALFEKDIRADDCEFYTAAKGWTECIGLGSFDAYQKRFESTSLFFKDRMPHSKQISDKMIQKLTIKHV